MFNEFFLCYFIIRLLINSVSSGLQCCVGKIGPAPLLACSLRFRNKGSSKTTQIRGNAGLGAHVGWLVVVGEGRT